MFFICFDLVGLCNYTQKLPLCEVCKLSITLNWHRKALNPLDFPAVQSDVWFILFWKSWKGNFRRSDISLSSPICRMSISKKSMEKILSSLMVWRMYQRNLLSARETIGWYSSPVLRSAMCIRSRAVRRNSGRNVLRRNWK